MHEGRRESREEEKHAKQTSVRISGVSTKNRPRRSCVSKSARNIPRNPELLKKSTMTDLDLKGLPRETAFQKGLELFHIHISVFYRLLCRHVFRFAWWTSKQSPLDKDIFPWEVVKDRRFAFQKVVSPPARPSTTEKRLIGDLFFGFPHVILYFFTAYANMIAESAPSGKLRLLAIFITLLASKCSLTSGFI